MSSYLSKFKLKNITSYVLIIKKIFLISGTYAYRYDDKERGGIWVGYEDTESMFTKATFARTKGLGGVAVVDITMDDFKGVCNGDKFPLLKAVKHAL